MNSIGFSYFRRFAEFPEIDLGDVTILVGGNNSGKSTIVKALLLCVDNLQFMRTYERKRGENSILRTKPVFRFDASEFHDVKVKTFARAIHRQSFEIPDPETGEPLELISSLITFRFTLGQFKFEFKISGDRDYNKGIATGNVESITITDLKSRVRYANYYSTHVMSYEVLGERKEKSLRFMLICELKAAYDALEDAKAEDNLDEIAKQSAAIDKIKNQIDTLSESNFDAVMAKMDDDLEVQAFISKLENGSSDEYEEYIRENEAEAKSESEGLNEDEITEDETAISRREVSASYEMPLGIDLSSDEPVVLNVIDNIIHFALTKGAKPKYNDGEDPGEYAARMQEYMLLESYRQEMMQDVRTMRLSMADLMDLLSNLNVEYISAHAANQNTLYNTADRNDHIAQTVHEFYREKILTGEKEYEFVKRWMQKFEIGIDFDITSIEGEAYQVRIKDADGTTVPLADKGMGSIQMMILLLRLATILRRNRNRNVETTIIIEEPEQNLHPKMQSLLADLFHEVSKEYGCHFLIETHSEYLVRKTQVIVSEQNYPDEADLKENNPFKVYYLPDEGEPYEMKYKTTGRFENSFGEGFFDEAGKANLITLRKERSQK